MDLRHFIKISSSFGTFSDADIAALADAMVVGEFPAGHVFTSQGIQGAALYLLIDGGVEVTKKDRVTGAEKDIKILRVGEIFGLLSLLDDMPAEATCTALGPVTAASMSRELFTHLDQSHSSVGFSFQFVLASQLARDLQDLNRSSRAMLTHGKPVN